MKLKPLGGRLAIAPIEQEGQTISGILLPETAKEKPQQGKVVAVGPGERDDQGKRIPMEVQLGDVILFGKYAGTEIQSNGQKYLILKENDALAIIERYVR
jgi:chaperonin GroES